MAGLYALMGNTTTTTGTGAYSLGGALPAPFRGIGSVLTNGQQFYGCCRDNVNFESAIYQYNSAGPTVSRITILDSSAGGPGNPVSWGVGTRNLFCDVPGRSGVMFGANNLSEITSQATAQASLGLGTAATATLGTANGNVPQLGASGLPAVGGSLLTSLPAILPAPATTAVLFYQAAAPAGWTRVTTIDDTLVSITNNSGTGGGGPHAGGTVDTGSGGTPWDQSSGLVIANHTLLFSEVPYGQGGGAFAGLSFASTFANTNPGVHAHSVSSPATYRPPRAYVSLCTKN
jgi:hypothetical protein